INQTKTWPQAQTYCRERYTDLATVFDTEDMNRLVNTAQDSTGGVTQKAWIGLHDNLTSWRWSSSDSLYYRGVEGDYRNWDNGQPDNFLGDQMCVKMWSGGVWEDSRCFLQNPFICYDGLSSNRFIDRNMNDKKHCVITGKHLHIQWHLPASTHTDGC
uniref:C-type lectin domain-containing protein n=1 Tax=Seriola dumerili TaxID=41447 RepID=A0A3B4UME5_SERDU